MSKKDSIERPFKCPQKGCDATYSRNQHLKRHFENTHLKTPQQFRCEMPGCLASFQTYELLTCHFNRTHYIGNPVWTADTVKCVFPGCEETFTSLAQLKQHNKSLHKRMKCRMCSKTFELEIDLKQHEEDVHKEKQRPKLPCDICDIIFVTRHALYEHKKSNEHLENQKKALTCSVCNITFTLQSNFNAHTTIHSTDRRIYSCKVEGCSKFYYHQKNLTNHIKVSHERDKLPNCSICNLDFSCNARLRNHIKVIHAPGYVRTCKRKNQPETFLGKLVQSLSGKQDENILKVKKTGPKKKRKKDPYKSDSSTSICKNVKTNETSSSHF